MSVFGVILVRMREYTCQNNSEYGHFSRSAENIRNVRTLVEREGKYLESPGKSGKQSTVINQNKMKK